MPANCRRCPALRVSSARIISTASRVWRALGEKSPRLPRGVATIQTVPNIDDILPVFDEGFPVQKKHSDKIEPTWPAPGPTAAQIQGSGFDQPLLLGRPNGFAGLAARSAGTRLDLNKDQLFPSSQTMSISPPAHRKLRSTTRKPFSTRKAAASSSPSFPMIRCRAGTASSAAVRGARPGTSCGGRDSGRACPAPRDAPGSRSPCERPTRIPDNARP